MCSIQMIRSHKYRYICCLWSPDSSHKRSARVIRSCSFVIKGFHCTFESIGPPAPVPGEAHGPDSSGW